MTDNRIDIAVVGATGLVGEALLEVLAERDFPVGNLWPLASDRSLGRSATYNSRAIAVLDLAGFDFARSRLVFLCAGPDVSRELAPKALAAGCTVVDASGAFSSDEDVPLIVPEVNLHALDGYAEPKLVASPHAATVPLVMALKPIHEAVGLEAIHLATYQSASGAGREAVEELARQSISLLSGQGPPEARGATRRSAFNCVPQIDGFEENGYTRDEMAIALETRRILEAPGLRVNVTTVRVPVFHGDAAVVSIETRSKLSAAAARKLLEKAPGIEVLDTRRPGGYATAANEAANRDTVYVSRIREYLSESRGLNLWIVADNVRKGAASNSVQIAEALAARTN
jgi:aspartate-semialdehyde dehydrogenase